MRFYYILFQIQYSVSKSVEIPYTIADSLQYFYFIITAFNKGTVNSFAQIFSCSIDIAAQVSLSASARHRNGNNSAGTTFAY